MSEAKSSASAEKDGARRSVRAARSRNRATLGADWNAAELRLARPGRRGLARCAAAIGTLADRLEAGTLREDSFRLVRGRSAGPELDNTRRGDGGDESSRDDCGLKRIVVVEEFR